MSARATESPNCPGGGGSNVSSASSVTAVVVTIVGGGGYNSADSKNSSSCPTNTENEIIQKNKTTNLTTIDNSVMMMNRSSLTSMSSSVNQMIVNSITNTTTSSSQSVNITQNMNISVTGGGGTLVIDNLKQVATIDLSNSVSTDLSAVNNVRTDLANQILQEFKSGTQADLMSQASTEIETQIENQTAQSVIQKNLIKSTDKQESAILPLATAAEPTIPNMNSNIKTKQLIENDLLTATTIGAPFSITNDIERTISTSISNSVTQNFTHNTVTQLMQAINLNQNMNIRVEDIAGNIVISNISQVANVQLRQVLSQKMDIGTAIVNGIQNGAGIVTDDNIAIKKSDINSIVNKNGVRNSSSFKSDQAQDITVDRTISTGGGSMPSSQSSGSSFSSIFSSIFCIICCIAAPMLGAMIPPPAESESYESVNDSDASTSSNPPTTESSAPPEAVSTSESSTA